VRVNDPPNFGRRDTRILNGKASKLKNDHAIEYALQAHPKLDYGEPINRRKSEYSHRVDRELS